MLAGALGLTDVVPLRIHDGPAECKIVVFVPESDLGPVSDALFAAGAGRIGEYGECSFRIPGTGTFFGSDAANPVVGQKGRREDVQELRLEVVCPERLLAKAIAAVRRAHSYEEPAFDIYALRSRPSPLGEGRVGNLDKPVPFAELAKTVKSALRAAFLQVVGDAGRKVERIAVACGAAGEYLSDAARALADVFLTGELRFHDLLKAQSLGVCLLIPGHHATERIGVEKLADILASEWPDLKVWASQKEKDPLEIMGEG
jgi:hypothetical protein